MSVIQLEGRYLIHLLSTVIHDRVPEKPPNNLDWEKLYRLSTFHHVSNMVCYGVYKLGQDSRPPQELMLKFKGDCKKGMAKEATQHIIVEEVLKTFENNEIPCMPLKGYLIKYLYPQPDMRMMSDVDILFRDELTEQVKNLMVGMGFTVESEGGNHDTYYQRPLISIEMHRGLIAENYPYSEYFNKVWDRAQLIAGCKFTYELSKEDFYIYLIAHITKHYANGGTGIRSIMDLCLFNHHYENQMDWIYIQTELEKIRLWEFGRSIYRLSQVWFGAEQSNELYEEMTDFILSCGVYGTIKYSQANAINKRMNSNDNRLFKTAKITNLTRLFFPERKHLKPRYPFLERLPFLLPICWILRGVNCMLFKRKHSFQMLNAYSVSKEDVLKLRDFHHKTGLSK